MSKWRQSETDHVGQVVSGGVSSSIESGQLQSPWCWDLVFSWRSEVLTGCLRPCGDVEEGTGVFSSVLILLFVSVSFGVLVLRDGVLLPRPVSCEWLGCISCWLPWGFLDVMEVFPSRSNPSDLSWVLVMITQSNGKGFNELFVKRTETIFNLILQFFFSWKRKMKSIKIFVLDKKFQLFCTKTALLKKSLF